MSAEQARAARARRGGARSAGPGQREHPRRGWRRHRAGGHAAAQGHGRLGVAAAAQRVAAVRARAAVSRPLRHAMLSLARLGGAACWRLVAGLCEVTWCQTVSLAAALIRSRLRGWGHLACLPSPSCRTPAASLQRAAARAGGSARAPRAPRTSCARHACACGAARQGRDRGHDGDRGARRRHVARRRGQGVRADRAGGRGGVHHRRHARRPERRLAGAPPRRRPALARPRLQARACADGYGVCGIGARRALFHARSWAHVCRSCILWSAAPGRRQGPVGLLH